MNKLWIVVKHTYFQQIKTWSFLILILGPFLFVGISALSGFVSNNASEDKVAVVSKQPQLRQQFIKEYS
ncbi:ABC transporter permease, partial [Lactobacillus sp. XV13L]|nr:ABC transporter permease [Lactobacillus sp. XV13L]